MYCALPPEVVFQEHLLTGMFTLNNAASKDISRNLLCQISRYSLLRVRAYNNSLNNLCLAFLFSRNPCPGMEKHIPLIFLNLDGTFAV